MNVKIEIDPALQNRRDLIELVKASADFLASRDRESDSPAVAVWRLYPDPEGRPLVGLGLEDGPYSTGRTYTPKQLKPSDIRELRLLGVWNDLLRARSHRGLARVNELISQAEGD
jgi:hypothetical protein